ncbi:MAG: tandem-95 repeat protein [Deltaproteobacteria bacterium]|nr:tandem-95 repeat protein [Deltaproteobacteria bacterium]
MKFPVFFLLAVMSLGVSHAFADVIIDNGGSGTSSTGTWQVSGGTSPYGSNSLWARDGARYTWRMTSQPAGTYEVFMWWSGWSSRTTNAPVTIVHRDGSDTVSVNQQLNAGKWNSLGQYSFDGTGTVTITASNGSTVSTCADAVRFVSVGGGVNQPPTAVDDAASTTEGSPVTVNVISNDTDDGGVDASTVAVVGAPANGTAVPNGNGTVTYTPGFGFTGTDTFTYTVADAQGAVSNPATVTVTVNRISVETVIDNGGPGTSFTGAWEASGATGSFGSKSVWSRDGTKYAWTFTPSASGSYELSMWWTVWPSRSTAVPVDINHSGGTARVMINQQQNGGRWNVLGRFTFAAGQSYTVTITSQPGPSSTCADAVKFAFLGDVGNLPPTAVNDAAATTAGAPVTVNVISNDTDDGGVVGSTVAVVGAPANGTALPNGNGTVTYTPVAGYTGVDTFRYTVADTQGAVSNQATVTVTINTASTEIVIDNGGPGTSFTGAWEVSGATGSYGSKSVWSRDGSRYTWTFVPQVSGVYQVSMWWTVYSSRSTAVPVDIKHSGGTSRVTINQKLNGGKWNGLGIFSLVAGASYTVTVTSQPGPSSTCADAVKFALTANAVAYVAVGDSITAGSHDDISADGIGFEPILGNLLTASKGYSNLIVNQGVPGASSADGAVSISATLTAHPLAAYYLVQYGSNDAFIPAVPSGMGLIPGNAGYSGSYKDNLQKIISAILAAGKTPYLAEVPYTSDPLRSDSMIQEYNVVIDELVLTNDISAVPPAFYAYFKAHQGELADGLHPDGTGYQSMANLWSGALP